jgi:hypothetical protein
MIPDGIMELIDRYLDGDGSADVVPPLKAWLEEDRANVQAFAKQVFLHQQLREYLVAENSAQAIAPSEPVSSESAPKTASKPIVFPDDRQSGGGFGSRTLFLLSVTLLVVAGAAGLAFQIGRSIEARLTAKQASAPALAGENTLLVARLVKLTNCHWDATRTTADLNRGSELRPGQSLHLVEGVAEINSTLPDGTVEQFQLEGPLGLMMTSQHVPTLLYGKLSATIQSNQNLFALDTPLGRILSGESAIGVSVNSNEVELHVFSGDAVFEPLEVFRRSDNEARCEVHAGSSLRMSAASAGSVSAETGAAREDEFVTAASVAASQLRISPAYVAAVKAARPVAYWRFDHVEDGVVANEMSDQFNCRIQGPVRWRTYPGGNRSIEFGYANEPGYLLSEEEINGAMRDRFSVELWAKPSYIQSGAIFSLVRSNVRDFEVPSQGMLLEFLGQATDAGPMLRRIRFMHRNPPGRDLRTGVACYSGVQYSPRKWQHIAAVKSSDSIKLYLDGKQVADAEDTASTADDLRILMGQLYPFTSGPNAGIRPFVGELAEIAVYDRPLAAEEISLHVKLGHENKSREESLAKRTF